MVELLLAVTVLALVFASSVSLLAMGFRTLDDSRLNTLAAQVLQSEMENLRLMNWDQLGDLPARETFAAEADFASAGFERFSCAREIAAENANLKKITLTAAWNSTGGQTRERTYVTYIGRDGLNDYYYRSF
jgi:predicted signal transduction protein with EAL and GGDEF domain